MALTTGVTNAGAEVTNRVTKTGGALHCAYACRNPANQRLRTR